MEIQKVFYTMGDVAEMFDVNQSLIRYWDKEFSILKPEKNKKGNRLFRTKDIEAFRLIYHLTKEKGMTIEGAKRFLKQRNIGETNKDIAIVEKLEGVKLLLQEVLAHFDEDPIKDKIIFEDEN